MKALLFDGKLVLKDLPRPVPERGEVLIKVTMAGICKTDSEIVKGYMNFSGILGHEFVGIVVEAQDSSIMGARVVGEINCGCGECAYCKQGLARHCPQRTVLGIQGRNGAFAEFLTLPQSNLAPVPEGISDEKAVFTEPLAAVVEILEQVHIRPSDSILVVGDGKLGILVSTVFHQMGCDVVLAGKHHDKMEIFQQNGGSVMTIEALRGSKRFFDLVVEASGHPSGWDIAVEHLKPRGFLVLKSTYHGSIAFNPAPLVINEITVMGSRCGLFPGALRMLERGIIDPSPFISAVFPLDQAEEAFERSQKPGVFKVLLKM